MLSPYIDPTRGQAKWNKAMSAVRIAVKWCFKEVTQQFDGIDYKKMQKALLSPIGLSYCVAVLFHNTHVCLYQL